MWNDGLRNDGLRDSRLCSDRLLFLNCPGSGARGVVPLFVFPTIVVGIIVGHGVFWNRVIENRSDRGVLLRNLLHSGLG